MVRKALADPNSQSAKAYGVDQARLKAIQDEKKKILTPAPAATPGVGDNALTDPGTDISLPDDMGDAGGTNSFKVGDYTVTPL
jgi:hypothetical protein